VTELANGTISESSQRYTGKHDSKELQKQRMQSTAHWLWEVLT